MPPFSDEPVTVPFVPTFEDLEPDTSLPYVPVPVDHGRPVIPTDEDFDAPVIIPDPSPFRTLRLYRYRPKRGGWKHIPSTEKEGQRTVRALPSSVRIVTWNINFVRTVWDDRVNGVLRHLEEVLDSRSGEETNSGYGGDACVVLLQEVTPSMLDFLLKDQWVQKKFAIVPISADKWPPMAYFGNVTLVSRDLEVVKAQILHFSLTSNQRTGLFVYLRMAAPGGGEKSRIICIANTHLESLENGEHMRPKQLEALAQMLKRESIEGGVIAGDMNAIAKSDRTLPRKLGLKDAWRQGDSDPKGFTWGHQSPKEDRKYPPARLDKILYLPHRKYKVDEPQRIGVGLTVRTREGEDHWVSDHYGLLTTLHVTG